MSTNSSTTPGCDIREPLAQSAPVMRQLAKHHCRQGMEGCFHYHGFWQYLRLMGLGATLGGHPEAYLQAFSEWRLQTLTRSRPSSGKLQVLICGCADYSMLAHLHAAFGQDNRHVHIVAVDICQTPLAINQWYAERQGFSMETVKSDILDLHWETGFDLITTSSFFGYFSPESRPRLMDRIARLLVPGGCFISSNRLRPDQTGPVTRPEADIAHFADTVVRAGAGLPADCRLSEDTLRQSASAYARTQRPYPLRSVDDIERLSRGAGLETGRLETLQKSDRKTDDANSISGPTLDDGSRYVFFRLDKRAT